MMRAPRERRLAGVLASQRHEAWHFLLGKSDFLAAELGEGQVLHLERFAAGRAGGVERVLHFFCGWAHRVFLLKIQIPSDRSTWAALPMRPCTNELRVATNKPGPLASGGDGSGVNADAGESGFLEPCR